MIKAQSEKTYIKVGWCLYCGKEKTFIMTRKTVPQMTLNRMAFEKCDCEDAVAERLQRTKLAQQLAADGRYDLVRRITG